MIRGPQTLGELRTHCERMHPFDDLAEVESVIERLPELIVKLSRRPGEKEVRYAHLLSGTPAIPEAQGDTIQPRAGRMDSDRAERPDRIAALEAEIAQLRDDIENLKEQFAGFKRQFE